MYLYPLKLRPIFFEKIWGGNKISKVFNLHTKNIGEAWIASGLKNSSSIIINGPFKGRSLYEIDCQYTSELRGSNITGQFPILVKLLSSSQDLSVQVHPNDEVARNNHNSLGKTEMWYILDCEKESYLYLDFNIESTSVEILESFGTSAILNHIKKETVKPHESYLIPAGCFHSIGRDVFLAEIQQSSDITYRVYDFDRIDNFGKTRDLHLTESKNIFNKIKTSSSKKDICHNKPNQEIFRTEYFTTYLRKSSGNILIDHSKTNSFIIYLFLSGNGTILWKELSIDVQPYDCLLIPASINIFNIRSEVEIEYLEILP